MCLGSRNHRLHVPHATTTSWPSTSRKIIFSLTLPLPLRLLPLLDSSPHQLWMCFHTSSFITYPDPVIDFLSPSFLTNTSLLFYPPITLILNVTWPFDKRQEIIHLFLLLYPGDWVLLEKVKLPSTLRKLNFPNSGLTKPSASPTGTFICLW
jgi:hypothetical protein